MFFLNWNALLFCGYYFENLNVTSALEKHRRLTHCSFESVNVRMKVDIHYEIRVFAKKQTNT